MTIKTLAISRLKKSSETAGDDKTEILFEVNRLAERIERFAADVQAGVKRKDVHFVHNNIVNILTIAKAAKAQIDKL